MPINHDHTALLSRTGQIYVCGRNNWGQLGLGSGAKKNRLTPLPLPVRFISVAAGYDNFSIAVAEDGTLWSWGCNSDGQLGLDLEKTKIPLPIPNTQNFCCVSAGDCFALALDTNQDLWSFGTNMDGELGLGDFVERFAPTRVTLITKKIKLIVTGCDHSGVLDVDGGVWTFGCNEFGQLGVGDIDVSRSIPTELVIPKAQLLTGGYEFFMMLDEDGEVWGWGENSDGQLALGHCEDLAHVPAKVSSKLNIVRIWCGGTQAFAQTEDGVLYAAGCNRDGETGINDGSECHFVFTRHPLEGVIEVYACGFGTYFLLHNGAVYSCGENEFGQLSRGSYKQDSRMFKVQQFDFGIQELSQRGVKSAHK